MVVLVFDGTIAIIDPDTYADVVPEFAYPNSGNGNYVVFNTQTDEIIICGYDGVGSP